MLECVINLSEGTNLALLERLAAAGRSSLLDRHCDAAHNRSVFTLAGPNVVDDAKQLTRRAIDLLDLSTHVGVHPRIGVVDVVPFVPLQGATMADALTARDDFADWLWTELGVPAFLYGPERSLPELRRWARGRPTHPSAGACAVGAREPMVAYNLWLRENNLDLARRLAATIRSPQVRSLGLQVHDAVQVSCNLIAPELVGPADVYDLVAALAPIARAELVGLLPRKVLEQQPPHRWGALDVSADRTIEHCLDFRQITNQYRRFDESSQQSDR